MLCIPADSFTPMAYKMAAFESMFHRLYNIPMNRESFKKEESYIYETAKVNGYEYEVIKKIQLKHRKREERKMITLEREKKSDETAGRLLMMSYFPPLTDKIMKVAKDVNINGVYNSQGTLAESLMRLKDERPDETKSGIYRIGCSDCDEEYIGQSKRRVNERWKEHEAAVRLNQPAKSAVAEHCLSLQHSIGEKSLLKEVTSSVELNSWESYFIANSDDNMNSGEAPIRSNLFPLAFFNS